MDVIKAIHTRREITSFNVKPVPNDILESILDAGYLAPTGVGFGAVYNFEDAEESAKREDWVRNSLNIPNNRRILAILGFGYPENKPKAKKLPSKEEIIYYESFK